MRYNHLARLLRTATVAEHARSRAEVVMRRILLLVVILALVSESSAVAGRRRAVRHPDSPGAAPVAAADSYSVSQRTTLTVDAPGVLANDTVNGGAIASFGPSTGAEETTLGKDASTANGGTLSLSASGGFVYTPSASFTGTDTFRYVIANTSGTSSAEVTIDVITTETAAVADAYATAPEDDLFVPAPGVLTNDTLAGGARIAAFGPTLGTEAPVDGPSPSASGGVITLHRDGSFLYVPPPTVEDEYGYSRPFTGSDRFVYTIQSGSVSSAATVTVLVQNPSSGADYVVTTPGHYYAISGLDGENPALQLTRGRTYTFQINADPSHPFAILDAPAGSVTNNNITSGILTFTVPATAENYRYRCTTHGFGNIITTVP